MRSTCEARAVKKGESRGQQSSLGGRGNRRRKTPFLREQASKRKVDKLQVLRISFRNGDVRTGGETGGESRASCLYPRVRTSLSANNDCEITTPEVEQNYDCGL